MSLWKYLLVGIGTAIKNFIPIKEKAEGLYPPFEDKILYLLNLAEGEGMEVDVFDGYRSFKKQAALYAKGRTKSGRKVTNARPGHSNHNFGIAVDIVFKPKGRWSWAEFHPWKRLGELGKGLGLGWGGDWKRLVDRPHFQLKTKISLKTMRELHKRGGLQAVWAALDKEKRK